VSDACATGCRIAGQHQTTCEGECRGCLPRPAEEGTLCSWCWRTLTRAVEQMPELVAHLRAIGEPVAQQAPPSDTSSRTDPAEGSVLPQSWLFADEMMSTVTSWAQVIHEEHPAGLRGPNSAPWFGNVVAWLTPHLAWAARQDWAAEMRRELMSDIATARHRWPTLDDTEPARRVDVPCPRCDLMSLTYTPVRHAGQAFRVECDNPDCARVFSEDEWERFKVLALDVSRRAG
jgi:hypothetical protein